MDKTSTPVHAVIVAAGRSTRMGGGENKVFLPLGGRPVLAYSLSLFASLSCVTDITVVVRPEDRDKAAAVVATVKTDKPVRLVDGGDERIQSVANGINGITDGVVAIHDGARPLVTADVALAAIDAAKACGGAVAAVMPKDTVMQKGADGSLDQTLDRSRLMLAQTPQCFDSVLFADALAAALQSADVARFTDDTGVFRAAGHAVAFSVGSYENIKITTPEDLAVAEVLLKRRQRA